MADANPSGPGRGSTPPKNVNQKKQLTKNEAKPPENIGNGKDEKSKDPFENPYMGKTREVDLKKPNGEKSGTRRRDN